MGQADPLLAQKVHLLVRKKLNPGANGISNSSSLSEHAAQTHLGRLRFGGISLQL